MVKKKITISVCVTIPMSYTKSFDITKEVDFDEEWMKKEKWSEEEYVEENFGDEFCKEAEKLMDKELDNVSLGEVDFEDYESELDY